MVEGTGLENRHTGEPGIESSNLSLSVLVSSAEGLSLLGLFRLLGQGNGVALISGTGGRVV